MDRKGFTINIAVLASGLTLAIMRYVDDFIRRRRKRNGLQQVGSTGDNVETKAQDRTSFIPGRSKPKTIRFEVDTKQVPSPHQATVCTLCTCHATGWFSCLNGAFGPKKLVSICSFPTCERRLFLS